MPLSEQVTVPEGTLETMWRWLDLALDVFPILPSHQQCFLNSQWFWAPSLGLAGRQMCWGAAGARAFIFFGKPAGWPWEHFGLFWGNGCYHPLLTAHPALAKPSLSLSLCPQRGGQDTVLSVWHIPGPCHTPWSMALDSLLLLPQQLFSHLPFNMWTIFLCSMGWFRHGTCMIPSSLRILLFLFFPPKSIIYCWWKIWY